MTAPQRGGPPKEEPAPTPGSRLPAHHSNETQSTAVSGDAVRAAIELLTGLGYGLSAPCAYCGHPVSSPSSLLAGIGPKCRAKAVAA